ncbi:hypothetical protein [Mesorhizobium sp. L2C067A000]|uniref:hypothetical protein n=1 Tax=Mesorhizobium sp. L2C067A000 TaxID=1287106 RepID=UPI0003D0503A|nr:hypothetical protein [Mesorhizobium sp. L2C067A000]ESZ26596.1 hypothetical protein X733_29455 [Mesorhizobium sp. L2C067A000]
MPLFDIRKTINTIINSSADDTDIRTSELIRTLRQDHAAIITAARVELENIALTKIVNDVAARHRGQALPGQGELFGGYTGIRQTIVVKTTGANGKISYTRKAIDHTTLGELEAWLQQHTQTRLSRPEKFAGMRRMLQDAKDVGGAGDTTIGALLAERRRRELAEE